MAVQWTLHWSVGSVAAPCPAPSSHSLTCSTYASRVTSPMPEMALRPHGHPPLTVRTELFIQMILNQVPRNIKSLQVFIPAKDWNSCYHQLINLTLRRWWVKSMTHHVQTLTEGFSVQTQQPGCPTLHLTTHYHGVFFVDACILRWETERSHS